MHETRSGGSAAGGPRRGICLCAGAVLLTAGCTSGSAAPLPATDGGEAVAWSEAWSEACPPDVVAGRDVLVATVSGATGVTYATHAGQRLQLDVAWPRSGGPHPLVVLLHGGGWSGGSRDALRDEMQSLAMRGYAAATVDYRLTEAPRDVFPAAVADVRCAVRYLRSHADAYAIDPRRVAVVGFSAGAHLASLLGTARGVPELDDTCPEEEGEPGVQAVISYAGPQDLRVNGPYTQEQAELVSNFLGVFPGDAPARAALASPITHVSAGAPPFLLVHGADDDLVPVDHSRRMAAALRAVGTPASVLELSGVGHTFVGLTTSDRTAVRCTATAFLARWL